ncbi:HTH-type transcriptional activator RhaR [subsurface metagenome]
MRMIPKIERITKKPTESFYVGQYSNKWFERTWHYHPEYELLLITKGYGTRVIGDNQSAFKEGDLVLIGGNIHHAWFSDPSFFNEENPGICESVFVQFNRSIFGNTFVNLPEMKNIDTVLHKAEHGLQLLTEGNSDIVQCMLELPKLKGLSKLLQLIAILDLFQRDNYRTILSRDNTSNAFITKSDRIKKAHEFVMNNYMHNIKVNDVASLVEMNVSSFCRFFKKITQRTFSQYLKEIRIDFAQQLLINTNLPSNKIGYECGFSSIVYFNQCFKGISNMPPLEYRAIFKAV